MDAGLFFPDSLCTNYRHRGPQTQGWNQFNRSPKLVKKNLGDTGYNLEFLSQEDQSKLMRSWASHLTAPSLSFLICIRGFLIACKSWICCSDSTWLNGSHRYSCICGHFIDELLPREEENRLSCFHSHCSYVCELKAFAQILLCLLMMS